MKFNVPERIVLMSMLPPEGDIITLRIVKDLRGELAFSEEENEALQFKTENGRMMWKENAVEEKEIPIGSAAKELILTSLDRLNEEKKLNLDHIPLWDKFKGREPNRAERRAKKKGAGQDRSGQ